ncbi:MAG TPA: type II toxin-antitoxin system RelE/ParE family toxin [Candidatus Nesterenkonia stercoripullorum]|uniref:Type II toxin-antitoxin system RelE/ParE family toxin n=1 Tax=Candidatus Nesterenkonia stercoripullorum TaxID=2838701 RepID=A0A9D1UTQ9_9MICC|nr:type II toxin-antitoxin system RelE/ParE family toxin [Candidatus Nesterenkonia stercoripullorum]
MKYRVSVAREVAKTFRRIHPQDAKRLKVAISALAEDPRPPGSIQLAGGDGELRIRVGDYRVIYEIHEQEVIVLVLRVGHRRQVYR